MIYHFEYSEYTVQIGTNWIKLMTLKQYLKPYSNLIKK